MLRLTPNQAHYVLNSLVSQGRVRDSQVRKTLNSREEEIRSLRERLASLEALERSQGGSAPLDLEGLDAAYYANRPDVTVASQRIGAHAAPGRSRTTSTSGTPARSSPTWPVSRSSPRSSPKSI